MVPKAAGSRPVVRPTLYQLKMTFFESLFLGIVQGITEFFPISSSAHLKLIKTFFNLETASDFYLFDLFCHLGTILASIIFLRKEIKNILKSKTNLSFIFLAILPLVPFYFFFKPFLEFLSESSFLPYFLLCSALFLYIFSNLEIKEKVDISSRRKIIDVLLIGSMQALALIPGLSRSATTITSAYFRGWKINEAIKFSFLLSIPTILGGSALEGVKHLMKADELKYDIPILSYLIGFFAAFIVGFFAIKYIFSIRSAKKLKPFAWYMLIFAIFSFVYLNIIK